MPQIRPFLPLQQSLTILPLNELNLNLDGDLWRNIGIDYFKVEVNEGKGIIIFQIQIVFIDEIAIDFPGIQGLALVINSDRGRASFPFQFTIGSEVKFSIQELSSKIRIPSLVIVKARHPEGSTSETEWEPDSSSPYEIELPSMSLSLDSDWNFEAEAVPGISLSPGYIGDTGIVFLAENLSLYLDGVSSPPGRTPGWKGFYVELISIFLPPDFILNIPQINLEHAGIGDGGFFGTISLPFENSISVEEPHVSGPGTGTFLGMSFALKHIDLTFEQNVPVSSSLRGELFLPFFEKIIGLDLSIQSNGDLTVELYGGGGSEREELAELELENLLRFEIQSVRFQKIGDVGEFSLSGEIIPLLGGMDWPSFEINRLSINTNGEVEFDGGWINLPDSFTLDFNGFQISLSQFGMGSEERDGRERDWLGLSGEVQLMEGLPIRGAVEGLKFSWLKNTAGEGLQVSLQGIEVDLTIPGTLSFNGRVSYDSETNLFMGHIDLNLISLRMEMEASLMVGKVRNEEGIEFSVFYIYLGITLPSAIPLGATGTGLYGLAGLFGYNVAPTKTTEQNWYEWYKAAPEYDVTSLDKWAPEYDNLAFGVGVTLGTIYDDGTTISLSAMLVVLIPGPVIILEGKANLLQPRSNDRTAEGNFYLLAVLDCRAGTFQLNIDIRYSLEDIVSVGGSLEAFFDFNNDQNWYIYIGRKEPENKRIIADILSLFRASIYFMIDPRSLQFGASVGVNIDEAWGPVALRLIIRISVDTAIFFKPFQLEGRLELVIDLAVTIFGIGIRIMLQALLEGQTPDPFLIHGLARASLGLPFPLPSFDVQVEFNWTGGEDTPPIWPLLKEDESKKKKVYMLHHKSTEFKAELFHAITDGLSDYSVIPVVPVDARPSLTFAKTIHNLKKSDGSPILDIQPEQVGNGVFEYLLEGLKLDRITVETPDAVAIRNGINIPGGEVSPFSISQNSFTNGLDAKEPILELWRTNAMDNRNSYERETNTELHPPCRVAVTRQDHIVNWFDEPEGQAYDLIFTYKQLLFIADFGPEPNNQGVPLLPYVGRVFPLIKNGSEKALRITHFSIHFPQKTYSAEIKIAIGTGDTFPSNPYNYLLQGKLYDKGMFIATVNFQRDVSGLPFFIFKYENPAGFDTIRVEESDKANTTGKTDKTDKALWVYQITYLTCEEYAVISSSSGDSTPAVAGSNVNPGLMLEPDNIYRLTVSTSVGGRPDLSAIDYFYFKTDKGPGMIVPSDGAVNIVNQLPTYIADSFPVHGAVNHYYGYDIGVGFNETYVQKLYKKELNLRIRDRNGKLIGNDGNNLLYGIWLTGFLPLIKSGLLTWLQAKQKGSCLESEPPTTFQPLLSFSAPNDLKPNSLYVAELIGTDVDIDGNNVEHILHTFQFTTSRYKNFIHHFTNSSAEEDTPTEGVIYTAVVHKLPLLSRSSLSTEIIAPDTPSTTYPVQEKRDVFEEHRAELYREEGYITHARMFAKAQVLHEDLNVLNVECFDKLYPCLTSSFGEIGMINRPVPPGLEFLQIPVSGTDFSILLIESPEPMAWNRINGTIANGAIESEIGFIWNSDQTKAFLRVENSVGFKAGEHLLQLAFNARPDFTSPLYRSSSGAEDFQNEQVSIRLILE